MYIIIIRTPLTIIIIEIAFAKEVMLPNGKLIHVSEFYMPLTHDMRCMFNEYE